MQQLCPYTDWFDDVVSGVVGGSRRREQRSKVCLVKLGTRRVCQTHRGCGQASQMTRDFAVNVRRTTRSRR